jgi:hypothetical protein
MRPVEHHRLPRRAVVPYGGLGEGWNAGRKDGFVPRRLEEDVLGVVGAHGDPVGVVEGARVDAAGPRESLEGQEELRAAGRAEMHVDQLAAALGAMVVGGGGALGHLQIFLPEERLHHVRRAGRALAPSAVADRDPERVAPRLEPHRAADAAASVDRHGRRFTV